MKKVISLFLTVVMFVITIVCVDLSAYAETNSGYCGGEGDGTNVTYTITNRHLVLSGSGKMRDYSSSSYGEQSPFKRYNIVSLEIQNGITYIGQSTFDYSFANWYFTEINIPNSVVEIGKNAFVSCNYVEHLSIGSGLLTVSDSSFPSGLNDIKVDLNNKTYDSRDNCNALIESKTNRVIKGSNSTILPNNIISIAPYAFQFCSSLSEIIFPDTLISIGRSAFESCYDLKTIEIPDSVSIIDYNAFGSCKNLLNIYIGKNSQFISEKYEDTIFSPREVFNGCESIQSITINPENPYYDSRQNCNAFIYSKYNSLSLGCINTVIPNSIEEISSYSFGECINLSEISIPDSVKIIRDSAFDISLNMSSTDSFGLSKIIICKGIEKIEATAFLGQNNITDVYYTGSEYEWNNIDIDYYGNEILLTANIHYNSIPLDSDDNIHNDFTCGTQKYSGEYGYYYSDSYFNESATKYNQSLATMSLCVALSSYNANNNYGVIYNLDNGPDKNVRDILYGCNFENYMQYNYNKKPKTDSIACAIAGKKINDETVIAIAIRSGGYEAEWSSNMLVGESGNHQGFDESAEKVYSYLEDYIYKFNISGNVKIWISGYSRGAATANLLAAKLNERCILSVDFDKDDIYAYCFATPAGAINDGTIHSENYNNIYSIINYNDIVPLVAPERWHFDRYGITKVLPYPEASSKADKYESAMISRLNGMGYSYNLAEFKNYKLSPFATGMNSLGVKYAIDKNNKDSVGTFNRKFIKSLKDVHDTSNRKNYISGGLQWDLYKKFEDDYNNYEDYDPSCYLAPINNIISLVTDLGWEVIRHPNLTYTAIKNINKLYYVHDIDGACYLSWMQSMNPNYNNSLPVYFSDGNYRVAKINCPVDVYVYDNDNKLVASIIDEVPQDIEGSSIISSIDENGQKIVYLPCDTDYRVEVIARENCETTYTINECTGVNSEISRVISYNEVNMKKDETLVSTVVSYSENEIENGAESGTELAYTTELSNIEINPDLDVSGEEIADYTYTVDVQFNDEEGTITGGGVYTAGDFCQVTATNNIGYEFEGWYIDDIKTSSDYTYRFAVKDNVTVEANYIICEHSEFSTEIIAPTCTEDGYTLHSCSICEYSYKDDYIKSTGHCWDNGKVTSVSTCKKAGIKTYTCMVCGSKKTESIAKLKHTVVIDKAKAATCTATGLTEGSHCSVCKEVIVKQEVVAKKKHSNKTTVTKKATTKKNGSAVTKCTVCGTVSKTTTINAIKSVSLSKTSYVYDGKAKKPTVTVKDSKGKKIDAKYYTVKYSSNKNVGKATVTVTFKGNYSGTVKKTFTIKPKATSISKLTAGKKEFTVKWKKLTTQTTGYQIQYSTDKNFKKNNKTVTVSKNKTTSKSISKLKAKKKYYVRIRTYKTVNGSKIYSDWSKTKTVTTKK